MTITNDTTADTTPIPKPHQPTTPNWALQPFKDFLNDLKRHGQLLTLSTVGISTLRGMPGLIAALAEVDSATENQTTQATLAKAHEEAALARRESEEGFPLLHGYATLALWSSLEASFRLFLAEWIKHKNGALQIDEIQKLKVQIGEYESLSSDDRFFYIVDRLELDLRAALRGGICRFEPLLDLFGLSEGIDDTIRKDIFELHHVRNVLLHRGGKADRRFLDACPWLGLSIGQPVAVTQLSLSRYTNSVTDYVITLVCRVGECFGADMTSTRAGHATRRNNQSSAIDTQSTTTAEIP